MIDKLTPEQEALIPEYRDKWIGYGLSTEPADRAEAEAGVREVYKASDLTPPDRVIWLDSPMSGLIGAAMLMDPDNFDPDEVNQETVNARRDELSKKAIRSQMSNASYGQFEAGRLAYYDYMTSVLGVEGTAVLEGHKRVASSSGWWWPFDEAVILTERPVEIHRDDENRLHSETGMAISYPDGWGLYSWHGILVPGSLIDPGWTSEQILTEENAEIRRAAVEKVGWEEFVTDAGLIEACEPAPDPGNPGQTLHLYELPEQLFEEPVKLLLCTNGSFDRDGTRRRFGLTVPAHVQTPVQAAAWTYEVTEEEYASLQRRT